MSIALQPFSLPLRGSSLIEASAGTGKTYTIALLYVRLILQHGNEQAFSRSLTPDEILVVTFTDAATQELRDRIRARLSAAARCFLNDSPEHDTSLLALREDYPESDWLRCAQQLTLAAQSMDQSAISTIHGWCYRMLREHAFDSGSLFRQQLITQMQDVLAELVRDYWRQHFYRLDPACVALVQASFAGPGELLKAVRGLLNKTQTTITFNGQPLPVEADLEQALAPVIKRHAHSAAAQQAAREIWLQHWDELSALLDSLQPGLNKSTYPEAKTDADFASLKESLYLWAQGDESDVKLGRFAYSALRLKKGYSAPEHPALLAIDHWTAAEQDAAARHRISASAIILQHARHWLEQALEQRIHSRAELGFDDLLLQLDRALHGAQGEQLAAQIRAQYPAALIDEFQDTDPLQYRIFNRIYGIADAPPEQLVVLIGDPKQSIYSFRNADIHTYLAARTATTGRHFHLGTNFRSSKSLVDAVNTCFEHADQFPAGAFCFREASGDDPLPFHPVKANGRPEALCQSADTAAAAITFWQLSDADDAETAISKERYQRSLGAVCAARIATILQPDSEWRFAGASEQRVRASDIAILVRDRHEAAAIREHLQQHGLASVYLSDQESVFATPEAHDVLRWLIACAEPANESAVRAALGTASLGLTVDALRRLNEDEQHWEDQAELFRLLSRHWQTNGVLPMLRELMQRHHVPQRLVQLVDGERVLTNLLHLAEYLQQASVEFEGEQALIRHLREMIDNPGDEEILRLESDAELIRIVTIHKSKGLQYPLVFLPFAASWRPIRKDWTVMLPMADQTQQRRLEISPDRDDEDTALAEQERLAEDLRLLYVAMTRAVHGLWLGVGLLKHGNSSKPRLHESALGYLLAGGQEIDANGLSRALAELQQRCGDITVERVTTQQSHADDDQDNSEAFNSSVNRPATELQPARKAEHTRPQPWWISSYSLITQATVAGDRVEPEQPQDDQALEERMAQESELDQSVLSTPRSFDRNDPGLHGFARGPAQGTFLHNLLEWACAEGFANAASDDTRRLEAITSRCRVKGWQDEVQRLDAWLKGFLQQTFTLHNQSDLVLTKLQNLQPEMEFLLPAHTVDTADIDALCHQYLLPGHPRPRLLPTDLNGMLKGFIDLTFEHDGKYYVADWKSNHLGRNDTAYHQAALTKAVLEHRYDVQYALYLLALHRLLRVRLPDYDYQQHVGGAVYFFLRGYQADTQGVLMDRPPAAFIHALDQLFAGKPLAEGQP